ncbi:alternate-type signal peptide domain-containing protein [Georgenia wutianyii]|uniref:Alternate-type signal peptide domain-containing protein n=1 Tax=Georgenia wutianyii TaxID=2585135 RepID=A0ABX5VNF6_9MICO|nr:alternate-type signal peptide domain-containing protein [Georgenia wutianyii]QDB79743.1 alternate-type signal peptide domain-containing protein [Georgenia wutianyii]
MISRSSARVRHSSAGWKAVAAAGVGVVLLGAGGVTFAQWSDTQAAAVDTAIRSGVLDLEGGTGSWTNVVGTDVTAAVAAARYEVVPGDALTYRETLSVEASGDLLRAAVSHNLRELGGDGELRGRLAASSAMSLNGQPVSGASAPVVATGADQTVEVSVTVTFDETTAGLVGQGQSVNLGGLDVTLTQTPVVG